jgi:hypothetical protein
MDDGGGRFSCVVKMCTDQRSEKVKEVTDNPSAEMVWWFPQTSEQYRIRGDLTMVGADCPDKTLVASRKQLWGNLSDPARESFLDPNVPGGPYTQVVTVAIPTGGRDEQGTVVPPPENFLLMLLHPTRVDYLRLGGGDPQYRQVDVRDGQTKVWSRRRVNP